MIEQLLSMVANYRITVCDRASAWSSSASSPTSTESRLRAAFQYVLFSHSYLPGTISPRGIGGLASGVGAPR